MSEPTVQDVMRRWTVSVLERTPVKEIVRVLTSNHVSAVPVVDADRRVVGIVSASDLLPLVMSRRWHRFTAERPETDARAFMMTPAHSVPAEMRVGEAARLASSTGAHVLPVVDETGVLIGVASRGDLVSALLRADSDIRRDIENAVARRGASGVRVAVEQGVVSLTGRAESGAQAAHVQEAASRTPGVIAIASNLDDHGGFGAPHRAADETACH